ncbi:MAG: nucleotidyltransferase family protein [Devosia sp.]|nr:nucleotidyltransferase family protein [Devosia sp.]
MSERLRYAGQPADVQAEAVRGIIRQTPLLVAVLERLPDLALPDSWLVSGAIYNCVWNHLTGRPPLTGINDVDVFYFDSSDLSYEAENRVIRRSKSLFADLPLPLQIRNQARVHLWYERHFGAPYAPLKTSCEAVDRFASTTHAVAARLDGQSGIELYTPYGLEALLAFRVVPNRRTDNRETHERKAARASAVWPELVVEPW